MTENALLEVHPRAGRYVKTNQLLIKKKRKGHHASTHDGRQIHSRDMSLFQSCRELLIIIGQKVHILNHSVVTLSF